MATSRKLELAGLCVAVTAERRAIDQIEAFERRGASVLHAPTVQVLPAVDKEAVRAETDLIVKSQPDLVLVSTGYGLRQWLVALDDAGRDELLATLARSQVLVRGPKGRGVVRALGIQDAGMSPDETLKTLVQQVLDSASGPRTIAIQRYGPPDEEQVERLRQGGHTVLSVSPYRWAELGSQGAEAAARVNELVERTIAGTIDAITFTSALAAHALLAFVNDAGALEDFANALRAVVVGAVGPVTAEPLEEAGIAVVVPERWRMGALIKVVSEELILRKVDGKS